MTALRPEGTYGGDPLTGRHRAGPPADAYAGTHADAYAEQVEQQDFEAAVGRLADPLNDPLPGQEPVRGEERPEAYAPRYAPYTQPRTEPHAQSYAEPYAEAYRPAAPAPGPGPAPEPAPGSAPAPALDDRTMALRQAHLPADETMALRRVEAAHPAPREESPAPASDSAPAAGAPRPGGRAARRRAQRASRESPMVVASRVVGELFITLGVVMLLFVSYQLWWTNVIADRQAGDEAKKLEQRWGEKGDGNRDPGAFSAGQGFAIMHIPKLDVKVPVAEGVDEDGVLDRGMVGHYGEEPLKTAMPWDEKGNFAVAGHRNTHGEPFRYINKLDPGDPIVVETKDTYYVYEMANRLDSTLPSNVGVIDPVPKGSGFTGPGRYITLTTCTPEFTSKYRMIVWGKLAEERPRSEGKPDALVR
ncbi:class E sortase [Streptomyces radiopugnans]|uniref:class E sortase n=1 Tax=Streptomyces radiopugnans TaxID=403935 RepID=UPI003F1E145E